MSTKFVSRGMGNNWLPCFICGHQPRDKCQADTAFFVDGSLISVSTVLTVEGTPLVSHPITTFFHNNDVLLGKLDYRPDWPNRVQVKLGACGEHEPNLELLSYLCEDGQINEARLKRVIPKRKRP